MFRIMFDKLVQLVTNPKQLFSKNGKKSLLVFGIYFIAKWSLTIVFGQEILNWIKGI